MRGRAVSEKVSVHYSGGGGLAQKIAAGLQSAGKSLDGIRTIDLAAIDEFHFRGRMATLEMAEKMKLSKDSEVLDIGSGLGGAARALAEEYGCQVTGIDLTQEFCEAAGVMSDWVGLSNRTEFLQGDATNLPFSNEHFDAAITIHVAMNIAAKDKIYEQVHRVIKPGGIFAIYDILQGEGGEAYYPAPWARYSSISHLASTEEMEEYLTNAGFKIIEVQDSTGESLKWLEARTVSVNDQNSSPFTTKILFGDIFPEMTRNQIIGLRERRIRTVSFFCEA
jgi:ubiquinone/menaquinone biosynthesis C-methylase UbiE